MLTITLTISNHYVNHFPSLSLAIVETVNYVNHFHTLGTFGLKQKYIINQYRRYF